MAERGANGVDVIVPVPGADGVPSRQPAKNAGEIAAQTHTAKTAARPG